MKAEGGGHDSADEHGDEQGSDGDEWLGAYGEHSYGEDSYEEVVSSWGSGHDEPDEEGGEWGEPEY